MAGPSLLARGYSGGLPVRWRRRIGRSWSSCSRWGVLRRPSHGATVILESLRALEGVLRGVHHEVPFFIVLVGDLDRVERNGDILLAHAEEAADADDQRGDLALTVDEHVHDLADFAVTGIIDILFVPVSDG